MEGAGADCRAAWQNQLLELLQEPPSRGEAAAYQRRATLSSICVLSRSDPVARASIVPQLLDHVANSSANVEELDAGLRLMLRVLAVPAWGECSLCHTPRLLRSRPVGSLICGHPATLHMQRKCR